MKETPKDIVTVPNTLTVAPSGETIEKVDSINEPTIHVALLTVETSNDLPNVKSAGKESHEKDEKTRADSLRPKYCDSTERVIGTSISWSTGPNSDESWELTGREVSNIEPS